MVYMTYITSATSIVDSTNSSSSLLLENASFTGTSVDVSQYASITIYATSDVASSSNGLAIEFSSNGTNWDITSTSTTLTTPISPSTTTTISLFSQVLAQYMRVIYTNGSVGQTVFRLQTLLQMQPVTNTTQLIATSTGSTNKSTINADDAGNLNVAIQNPLSAFGEIVNVEPVPTSQVAFIYGLNNQLTTQTTVSSGTATASNSLLVLQSGTTTGGSATCQSINRIAYHSGQGVCGRFTALFTSGVENTTQLAGLAGFDLLNGYFFGYNGTSFGILHRRNNVDTWIPQLSWNVDTCSGISGNINKSEMNIDPTKGNVFQIKYQYLGFGNIFFYVENPATGKFMLVHMIQFSNANTQTNVQNPSMTVTWSVLNNASTNVTLKAASGSTFTEGPTSYCGPRFGIDNNKSSITTLTNILTLKCNSTINSITNLSQIVLRHVSASSANNGTAGVCVLQIIKNATLGGSPSYTNMDSSNSITSYDTAGTTVSGGIILYNASFASAGNITESVSNLSILANPGDTLTFAAKSTQSTTISVSVIWSENQS